MPLRFSGARRRLCVLSALLLTLAAMTAAVAERFVEKELKFSFEPPAKWKRHTDKIPNGMVMFVGPSEKSFAVNVNIYSEPIGALPLEKYIAASRLQISRVNAIKPVGEAKPMKLGGQPAYAWRTKVNLQGRPEIVNRQVFAVRNQRGYVITFSALPSTIKKYEPAFEKMLASFKWEK